MPSITKYLMILATGAIATQVMPRRHNPVPSPIVSLNPGQEEANPTSVPSPIVSLNPGQAGTNGYLGQAGTNDYVGQGGVDDYQGQGGANDYLGQADVNDYLGQGRANGYLGQADANGYLGQAGATSYPGQAGANDYLGQAGATSYPGQQVANTTPGQGRAESGSSDAMTSISTGGSGIVGTSGGGLVPAWRECNVSGDRCGSIGVTCCVAQGDEGSGKTTCRTIQDCATGIAIAPSSGSRVVADWNDCRIGTDRCASSLFSCCVGPADVSSGKSTCRPLGKNGVLKINGMMLC